MATFTLADIEGDGVHISGDEDFQLWSGEDDVRVQTGYTFVPFTMTFQSSHTPGILGVQPVANTGVILEVAIEGVVQEDYIPL